MHPQRNVIKDALYIQLNENSESAGWDDYDKEAANKAYEEAIAAHPNIEELRRQRDEQQQEMSRATRRAGHTRQEQFDKAHRESVAAYNAHPATQIENELRKKHDPLFFHTLRAADAHFGMARAHAARGRNMGAGEVDEITQSEFREFNSHPTHGGTVPFARFKTEISYWRED